LTAAGVRGITREVGASDAILVGPGMQGDTGAPVVRRMLGLDTKATIVVDAAALPAFRRLRVEGRAVVLTPNAGEMAQITRRDRDEIDADPARFAKQIARDTGAVVVCKCSPTVVVAPDGRAFFRPAANAGLGTSGSG